MAVKYIPFYPDPIEGQAILNNFKRTLKYKGSGEVVDKLKRGMVLYELEKSEVVGKNPRGNMFIRGECNSACAYLKEQGIKVDLVYIDPPFASGADYAKKIYIRRNPQVAKALSEAEIELQSDELKAFEEKMYGDIWDKEKYLNWMYENLLAIKSVMSTTASIYVHLDYHIGHYVKILMDEIFGESNFRSEIIWKRTTAHSDAGYFGNNYDCIYFYSLSDSLIFNDVKQDYDESYLARFTSKDPDGRLWESGNLTAKGLKGSGYDYEYKGFRSLWRCPIETMEKLDREGRLHFTKNGGIRLKAYKDELKGMPCQSLWDDIHPVNSQAAERTDYSTQKPMALLERIINVSSNENMLIADFFGGSGVTAAVANKLNRRFIHCDVGINSIQTARDRLIADKAEFDVFEIKDGISLYRNPVQTMNKLKSLISGLKNEDSLDKFWEGAISDSKLGLIPVFVPNLMDSGTKFLDEVMMNRILHEAIPDLDNNVKKVIIYYVDVDDIEKIKIFILQDESTNVEIELRDLKELLDDVVVEDYVNYTVEEVTETILPEYKVSITKILSDRVNGKIDAFNQKGYENTITRGKSFEPITISENGLELIEYISLDCTTGNGEWHSECEIKIDKLGYVILNGVKTKEFWDGTIKSEKPPLRIKVRNICGDETISKIINA